MLVSCNAWPSATVHAEDPVGQPPDRAGHVVAIGLQRRHVGHAHARRGVDLHPLDDGQEILALQPVCSGRVLQRVTDKRFGLAAEQPGDLLAPGGEAVSLLRRRGRIVGDIVDLAAEGVDGVHRLALGARQHAHGPVEG
jgi:hypothetical protein